MLKKKPIHKYVYYYVYTFHFVADILSEVNQSKESTSTECSLNCYKCIIKTKYYNTSINLIPFSGKLEAVPEKILQATEALIIYFDSQDVSVYKSNNSISIILPLLADLLYRHYSQDVSEE